MTYLGFSYVFWWNVWQNFHMDKQINFIFWKMLNENKNCQKRLAVWLSSVFTKNFCKMIKKPIFQIQKPCSFSCDSNNFQLKHFFKKNWPYFYLVLPLLSPAGSTLRMCNILFLHSFSIAILSIKYRWRKTKKKINRENKDFFVPTQYDTCALDCIACELKSIHKYWFNLSKSCNYTELQKNAFFLVFFSLDILPLLAIFPFVFASFSSFFLRATQADLRHFYHQISNVGSCSTHRIFNWITFISIRRPASSWSAMPIRVLSKVCMYSCSCVCLREICCISLLFPLFTPNSFFSISSCSHF